MYDDGDLSHSLIIGFFNDGGLQNRVFYDERVCFGHFDQLSLLLEHFHLRMILVEIVLSEDFVELDFDLVGRKNLSLFIDGFQSRNESAVNVALVDYCGEMLSQLSLEFIFTQNSSLSVLCYYAGLGVSSNVQLLNHHLLELLPVQVDWTQEADCFVLLLEDNRSSRLALTETHFSVSAEDA